MHAIAITSSGERRKVEVMNVCFGSLSLQITLRLPHGEQEIKSIVCFDVYAASDDPEVYFVAAKHEKGYPFTNLQYGMTFTLCYRLGL